MAGHLGRDTTRRLNGGARLDRGATGKQLTEERYAGESRGRIKSCLIIVILVEQSAADAGSDDPGHAPGGKEHAIVDAGVLRAPEIGSGDAVDGELGAIAPIDG